MRPAVRLPGEHQAAVGAPQELVGGGDLPVDAPPPLARPKDLPRLSRRQIGELDRPGGPRAPRLEAQEVLRRRQPQEGEGAAVRRPGRLQVAVDARSEEGERPRCQVVDADKGVVPAVALEGEAPAVGRPVQVAGLAAGMDELCRLRLAGRGPGEGGRPDLAAADEGDPVAARRDRRAGSFAQPAGRPALGADRVDRLLGPRRIARRVGALALRVGLAAADIEEGAPVGGPGEIRDLLPVVGGVGGEPVPVVVRRRGHPDVSHPALHEHPGQPPAGRRRGELRGEGRAHHLLQAEGRRRGSRRQGDQGEGQGEGSGAAAHGGGLRGRERGFYPRSPAAADLAKDHLLPELYSSTALRLAVDDAVDSAVGRAGGWLCIVVVEHSSNQALRELMYICRNRATVGRQSPCIAAAETRPYPSPGLGRIRRKGGRP